MTRPRISGELICIKCNKKYLYDDLNSLAKCPNCNAEHSFVPIEHYENYKHFRAEEQRRREENANKPVACPKMWFNSDRCC